MLYSSCCLIRVHPRSSVAPAGFYFFLIDGQLSRQSGEEFFPVAELPVAEEAHGGIPGGVVAVGHPSPVADIWQGHPHRYSQSTGEVRWRAVGRDDEVEVH